MTRRCALRCKHCRGSARDEAYEGELSTAECKQVIDGIADYVKPVLILTGGEPMTRPDIYELARYAADTGMRVVMAPCGHLITPETARRLKEAGIQCISISIDGSTPAKHDAFRGVEGAYARTIEGLQHAIDAGIPFQVNTTVTTLNVNDLPAILERAIELGAITFDIFFLVPTGRAGALRDLEISPEQAESALQWAAEMAQAAPIRVKTTCAPHFARMVRQTRKPAVSRSDAGGQGHGQGGGRPVSSGGCMAGQGFVFISHRGVLQPCGFLETASGDLRKAAFNFQRAYEESQVFQDLRAHERYEGKCGACEFLHVCGGCRARAYELTGDYLAEEPQCTYVPQHATLQETTV
jgi:radical SAM protein with 4Fe4S-binding SPASM domain